MNQLIQWGTKFYDLTSFHRTGVGVNCEAYHSGLSNDRRKRAHSSFIRDEVQVLISSLCTYNSIDREEFEQNSTS